MSLLPLWEDIEKLSPDPATLERCYRLASQRYLKDIGTAEGYIWGKIKTSGASFYQVCWHLDTLISVSNSPIHPKPDKYTLALAFYYCKNQMFLYKYYLQNAIKDMIYQHQNHQSIAT